MTILFVDLRNVCLSSSATTFTNNICAMNSKRTVSSRAIAFVVFLGVQLYVHPLWAQGPPPQQRPSLPPIPLNSDTTHSLAKHFTVSSSTKKTTDARGFIQRWWVLEPIKKDIARNNILTDSYLRTTISTDNFSSDFT